MSMKRTVQRISNIDMKLFNHEELNSLGIYIQFDEYNILEAKAMIVGPQGSIYEGGFLFFSILFPTDYPFSPPDVAYISRNNVRIHPNLYVGKHSSGHGKVCLSILGTWSGPKWTTIMNIKTVLLSIQSLLDENPFYHEPGQKHAKNELIENYNKVIEYETIETLLLKNMNDTPQGYEYFQEAMEQEFKKHKDMFFKKIDTMKDYPDIQVSIPFYRIMNKNLKYKELSRKYKKLVSKFE